MVATLKRSWMVLFLIALSVAMTGVIACSSEPETIIKTVEVEKIVEVEKEVEKEVIIFSDLNWSSALLQSRIAAFIVEHGYGYPVDFMAGDTVSLFPALTAGDVHVNMEIWLPNQDDVWNEAIKEGTVVSVGKSLDDNWQSMFVIPRYTQEANPGLVSYTDIEAHKDLFTRPDSDGKAALINCIAGWKCEQINTAKHALYGMDDYVKLVGPGSAAGLFADLEGAYEKGDDWLGYLWGPTKTAATLDLVVLEEAKCPPGCNPAEGYAYPSADVLIATTAGLEARAADVVAMLRNYNFVAAAQVAAEGWMADNDATETEAAINWLNNGTEWHEWVTAEAKANVEAALAAGKTVSNAD